MSQNGSRVKYPALKVFEKAKTDRFLHAIKGTGFFFQGELMFIGFLLERVKDRLATDK